MKKMTRNEFLKMAGTSAALVVFNTVLMPAAVAVEPGVVALSSKKSSIEIDKGTTVNSATFKLVPISRETFWGDAGSCTLDYLSEGYIQWTITVPGAVIVSFEVTCISINLVHPLEPLIMPFLHTAQSVRKM